MANRTMSTCLSGSNANNPELQKYIEYIMKDSDTVCPFEENYLVKNNIPYIDGKLIGTKDANDKRIMLEDLMSSKSIKFSDNNIGLYMPHKQLVKRKIYNWFCKMNEEQVLNTNCAFSYYILSTIKD